MKANEVAKFNRSMSSRIVLLLGVSHLAVFGLGYALAPKDPVNIVVKSDGLFTVTTTKVLSTTIESLRSENKLLVFSYKGTARVKTERTKWWIFDGSQELIVPAVVNYYLDLSNLTLADVSFNEKAKIVTVNLPRLTIGDIAFQPENATKINGGIVTWSEAQVQELEKLNYGSARRAMVAQAQQRGLVDAAKQQAQKNVTSYFEIPLRIVGQPDVKVVTKFR
jgi:hypothetical protein